jgi:hypothetical protein
VQYYPGSNQLYLLTDDRSAWQGPLTPGGSGTLSNTQCTLNAATSSAAVGGSGGTQVALTLGLTFSAAFTGVQQVWATAFSQVQGLPSGWQQAGTWTVNPFSSTLPAYSVSAPGTQGAGGVFTFQMTDVNGARFMPQAYLTFDTSLGAAGCAVILYHDSGTTEANGAWLVADDGSWIGPVSPGSGTTESNSRCQIGGAGTAGSDAGNVWTYKLAVSFTAAFAGAKNIYMNVLDHAGQSTGWQTAGTYTVGTAPAGDFGVGIAATSGTTITAGGSATYAVTVTPAGSFGGVVSFQASGLPSGATASFNPATVTGSGTTQMTVTTASGGGTGTFSVAVTGTSGALVHSAAAGLTVSAAPVATTLTIQTNPSGLQITVAGVSQGTPYYWTCSGGSITVGVPSTPQSGGSGTQYVYGSWSDGGSQSHSVNCPASSTTYTASFITQYYLTMTAGAGGSVSPPSGWQNSGQSVGISGVPLANYSFGGWSGSGSGSYSGTGQSTNVTMNGPISETASFTLAQAPDFAVSVGAATTAAGSNAVYTFTVTPLNGFNGTLNFAVSGLPALAAVGSVSTQGWQTTLTVSTQSCTPLGTATPTLTATSGSLSHSYLLSLTVTNPSGGAPVVCGISPTSGAVGTPVTIWGVNFGSVQGTSTVTFGGAQATVASGSWSATSILTTVPAGAVSGPVVVAVGGSPSNGVGFTPALSGPAITGIPASGAIGSSITITGTGFGSSQGGSTVAFNGTQAGPAQSWSATSIVVQVPVGATSGYIAVTVNGVQASSPTQFTVGPYVSGLSLTQGPALVGFVINGSGFGTAQAAGNGTVKLGGSTDLSNNVIAWGPGSITVQVPANTPNGNNLPVVVTVNGVPSNNTVSFSVVSPFGCAF